MTKVKKLTLWFIAGKLWNAFFLCAFTYWTLEALFPDAKRLGWTTAYLLLAAESFWTLTHGPKYTAYMAAKLPELCPKHVSGFYTQAKGVRHV